MRGQPSLHRVRITSDDLRILLRAILRHRDYTIGDLTIELGQVFLPRRRSKEVRKTFELKYYTTDALKDRLNARSPTAFSEGEIDRITIRLDKIVPASEWGVLPDFAQPVIKKIFRPDIDLSNALAEWSGAADNQSDFIKERTGLARDSGNGRFLVLRLSPAKTKQDLEAGELLCSQMLIAPPTTKSPLPQFLTRRRTLENKMQIVRGVIFEREGLIYSMGRARHSKGFRTAIVRSVARSTDRFDMFGSRVGTQGNPDTSFSYPIYCYQLKRKRSSLDLLKMLGRKSREDAYLNSEVNGFEEIMERLERAAQSPYGVIC